MAYTGAGQVQRVGAGASQYGYTALALSSEQAAAGATYYTRGERGELIGQRAPTGRYYYLFDGLGSTAAVTDASGNVAATYQYDPYGRQTGATGTLANPWRFGGPTAATATRRPGWCSWGRATTPRHSAAGPSRTPR